MPAQAVTLEQINAAIVDEHYFTAAQGVYGETYRVGFERTPDGKYQPVYEDKTHEALSLKTFCILVLNNGWTQTGESSCADPLKFNAEEGRKYARQDAVNKIWPLMGFELKTKLSLIDQAGPITGNILSLGSSSAPVRAYVGTKVIFAVPMNRLAYNLLRGWEVPADENPKDEGYLVQYTDGGRPNMQGFTGYVSWSPKEVFEKAYTVSSEPRKEETFLDRLKKEHADLFDRLIKLQAFMESERVLQLPEEDADLLRKQFLAMFDLERILKQRLSRLV